MKLVVLHTGTENIPDWGGIFSPSIEKESLGLMSRAEMSLGEFVLVLAVSLQCSYRQINFSNSVHGFDRSDINI